MMPVKTLIPAFYIKKTFKKDGDNYLRISEFFYDSIQGEGVHAGKPAAFLRLQGCTFNCNYCDTTAVWHSGNIFNFSELIDMIEKSQLIQKFAEGQHFVITGGSPLMQQPRLINFLQRLYIHLDIFPVIEIENECSIMPSEKLINMELCWNNSPKLSNSNVPEVQRYQPTIIKKLASIYDSWFKFVISKPEDWEEIERMYLKPKLIQKEQIILMPEANTREQLIQNSPMVAELAITQGVRFSSREHILLWDKMIGV